jgi:hypothetical protein
MPQLSRSACVVLLELLLLPAVGCNVGQLFPAQTIRDSGLELDVSDLHGTNGTRVVYATVVLRNTSSEEISFDLRSIYLEFGDQRVPAVVISIDRDAPTELVIPPAYYSKRLLRKQDHRRALEFKLMFELKRVVWRKMAEARLYIERADDEAARRRLCFRDRVRSPVLP